MNGQIQIMIDQSCMKTILTILYLVQFKDVKQKGFYEIMFGDFMEKIRKSAERVEEEAQVQQKDILDIMKEMSKHATYVTQKMRRSPMDFASLSTKEKVDIALDTGFASFMDQYLRYSINILRNIFKEDEKFDSKLLQEFKKQHEHMEKVLTEYSIFLNKFMHCVVTGDVPMKYLNTYLNEHRVKEFSSTFNRYSIQVGNEYYEIFFEPYSTLQTSRLEISRVKYDPTASNSNSKFKIDSNRTIDIRYEKYAKKVTFSMKKPFDVSYEAHVNGFVFDYTTANISHFSGEDYKESNNKRTVNNALAICYAMGIYSLLYPFIKTLARTNQGEGKTKIIIPVGHSDPENNLSRKYMEKIMKDMNLQKSDYVYRSRNVHDANIKYVVYEFPI